MKYFIAIMIIVLQPFSAYANDAEDRKEIQDTRKETLARLYKEEPRAKAKIAKAAGYATFSNIGINVVFISAGGGSGVVHNNSSGKDTYMLMASGGFGFGLGIKDFSAVFIFRTKKAMNSFIESGWDFSGQVDAAAKSGDKGDEASVAGTVVKDVQIYQMTKNGLALQATLQGTKYWVDGDLN
jgi:lipid-binding SYLF domain-containing protein